MADKYLLALTGVRALVNKARRTVLLLTRRGVSIYGRGSYHNGIVELNTVGKGWREVDEAAWEAHGGLTGEVEEAAL